MYTEDDICPAISDKSLLSFNYESNTCIVEPYILGYNNKNELSLIAWEFSANNAGWHMYRISELYNLTIMKKYFSPDREIDSKLKKSICSVVCHT